MCHEGDSCLGRDDSPKVTVYPTNREIGSMFAGQTDGLQERPGARLGLCPGGVLCLCPQPSWQSRAYVSSRAGLFKVGSTPEIYLVFVLVRVARFHMTFGLMEDRCIRSLPCLPIPSPCGFCPTPGWSRCPPLGLGFAQGSRS